MCLLNIEKKKKRISTITASGFFNFEE